MLVFRLFAPSWFLSVLASNLPEDMTPPNRILEPLPNLDSLESKYGEYIAPYLLYQMELDERFDRFTPATELMTELTPLDLVTLDRLVSQTSSSVTFSLSEHTGYLIKYMTNCDRLLNQVEATDTETVHPLIRTFYPRQQQFVPQL